jgi:threonine synthase
VTLAGLKKLCAQGKVAANESVVLILTGHTLKDADYTINFHRGSLLTNAESAGCEEAIAARKRDAIVVDAKPEAVLATLKGLVE